MKKETQNMNDKTNEAQAALTKMPSFDISNEAWREYVYHGNLTLRIENAVTLILDKRVDGDRHRLIVRRNGAEEGVYVTPGWLAIRWQTPDGKHGIAW